MEEHKGTITRPQHNDFTNELFISWNKKACLKKPLDSKYIFYLSLHVLF